MRSSVTTTLADFVHDATFDLLPPEVVDHVGQKAARACRRDPWARVREERIARAQLPLTAAEFSKRAVTNRTPSSTAGIRIDLPFPDRSAPGGTMRTKAVVVLSPPLAT